MNQNNSVTQNLVITIPQPISEKNNACSFKVFHLPQNSTVGGGYMTVVPSPKVVPARGKQQFVTIQNNSQSGQQPQQQIVLQPDGQQAGQQLVIPQSIGNLARGPLVFNSNQPILQSGSKIFIQQSTQGHPVILVSDEFVTGPNSAAL